MRDLTYKDRSLTDLAGIKTGLSHGSGLLSDRQPDPLLLYLKDSVC